ncbi:MAG: hypothetical protein QOJ74_1966, partial [Ilumatobacteraceae bacterium]|nr:hypothetical protein [Ilumatobacteraceae bacterium]
ASPYADPQTLIAPLVGPGETADLVVQIPLGAPANQRYALIDAGRQMNHGNGYGFGGALTFFNVWPAGTQALAFLPAAVDVGATTTTVADATTTSILDGTSGNQGSPSAPSGTPPSGDGSSTNQGGSTTGGPTTTTGTTTTAGNGTSGGSGSSAAQGLSTPAGP